MRASAALLLSCLAVACSPRAEMRPPREPVLATHANAVPREAEGQALGRGAGLAPQPPVEEVGLASWYGRELAGHPTASGEKYDPRRFTAAHKRLPFGTWVEVRRIDTGRVVRVRINDRGPNGRAKARIIDLSQRAAEDLDLIRDGITRVELRVVGGPL